MPENKPQLLTTKSVMNYLNISRTQLWKLVKSGTIPAYKIGSDYRYKEAEIDAYLERQRVIPDDPDN